MNVRDEAQQIVCDMVKKFKKDIMMTQLKIISYEKGLGIAPDPVLNDAKPKCKKCLKTRLNELWKNSMTLSLKNKGTLVYSIIPRDLLMRTYYDNKVTYDLLAWMADLPKLSKVKSNQILMHLSALILEQTPLSFEGQFQDDRVGLDINK